MKILTPLFACAALLSAQAAFATPTPAPTKTPAAVAKPAPVAAKPKAVKAVQTGRMVTTKTTTGKTITYNCSKAGNATKKACK